jgi:hypothetical protein
MQKNETRMRYGRKMSGTVCACRFDLSQSGAAHFIDGACGNFTGRLALYRQAGWSTECDQSAFESHKTYTKGLTP